MPTANISNVTTLSLQNNNVSDLTGIEDFTALESFNCSFNQLTTIDMTSNTALTSLTCNNNQINSLTINNVLQSLVCYNNQLVSLDVSINTLMETINCSNNQITDLDLSNNPVLTNINCNNNQMVTLDIRNGNNPIITNQFFNITSNPNLACVFVDDVSFSSATWFNIDPTSTFVETQGECDALGVDDELLKDNLSIYPNPARGEVTIMASNGIEVSKIEVYDVLGKKIKEMNYSSSPIDVSQLKSGVYYMSIIVNDNRVIKKLIKN
ncbi:MAG: T9SS type A sorting domain-containing protein [Urechidicola sp.]|nr:T9SS type A sorting domain-containing protein [Urechidicola sp.]